MGYCRARNAMKLKVEILSGKTKQRETLEIEVKRRRDMVNALVIAQQFASNERSDVGSCFSAQFNNMLCF